VLGWGLAGVALALAGAAVALVLSPVPRSPRGPEPGRTLYQAHCATCHGAAGRGDSWRARLLFLRPGNLASPAVASLPDRYLSDLIRHGGSTFGKPGMPAFGFVLSDAEIEALIQYVRSLPRAPRDIGQRGAPAAGRAPDRTTAGTRRLARRLTRDPLVSAGLHALVEDTRVDAADRGELEAVLTPTRGGAHRASLDRNGAIPVGQPRAAGLVPLALGPGPAGALPADAGPAGRTHENRQGQCHDSPHGSIVPRTWPPW
jgi:mono/diheme cytochrome c family protein